MKITFYSILALCPALVCKVCLVKFLFYNNISEILIANY